MPFFSLAVSYIWPLLFAGHAIIVTSLTFNLVRFYPEFLYVLYRFHIEQRTSFPQDNKLKVASVALPVHERAVRNCPWVGHFWVNYIKALVSTTYHVVLPPNEYVFIYSKFTLVLNLLVVSIDVYRFDSYWNKWVLTKKYFLKDKCKKDPEQVKG